MPPTEENCLALAELLKRRLCDPHGGSIDTFTVDCGWQNYESLYEFLADHSPDGFTPLIEAIEKRRARRLRLPTLAIMRKRILRQNMIIAGHWYRWS